MLSDCRLGFVEVLTRNEHSGFAVLTVDDNPIVIEVDDGEDTDDDGAAWLIRQERTHPEGTSLNSKAVESTCTAGFPKVVQ